MISPIKFKKILNDIKRRPKDAALDLGISEILMEKYLKGEVTIPYNLVSKAVDKWSVNFSEFFHIKDDTTNNFKLMTKSESDNSARIMERNGTPYYLYKDTAYSRLSPFKPEWIEELVTVDNNDPENEKVVYNNGHFLHQFTYFIGEVNFYYIENGIKKVSLMNTGDSMYISPYIPHSFTTRKNNKNINGIILALTYADKVDYNCIDELSAIGSSLSKEYKLELENKLEAFKSNLKYFLEVSSYNLEEIYEKIKEPSILNILEVNEYPKLELVEKIADVLNVNLRDLIPIYNDENVQIKKYLENTPRYLPSSKDKIFSIVDLAGVKKLPVSRAFEITILKNNSEKDYFLKTPLHQYIYNIGDISCNLLFDNNKIDLEPNDSIYLKPNLKHLFVNKGAKLLVLRTGGRISGDPMYHFSLINKNELSRAIEDNKPWFNY